MTVQDAAIQILLSAGKPLHAKEIAKKIIERKPGLFYCQLKWGTFLFVLPFEENWLRRFNHSR